MEEVSPYSRDVVFLAQLAIITIYSPCSAVQTTIRNATVRDVLAHAHTHTHAGVHSQNMCVNINIHGCKQQQTSYSV